LQHDRQDLLQRPGRRGIRPIEPQHDVEAVGRPLGGDALRPGNEGVGDGGNVFVLPADKGDAMDLRDRCREIASRPLAKRRSIPMPSLSATGLTVSSGRRLRGVSEL
jgi:hypothetical protein